MVFQNGTWKFLSLKIGHFWAKSAKNELFLKKYAFFIILRATIKNYMLFYPRKIDFDPYFQ